MQKIDFCVGNLFLILIIGIFILDLSGINSNLIGSHVSETSIIYDNLAELKLQRSSLADEIDLPFGFDAELLIEPDLKSPLFITNISGGKLLITEHFGARLLRIDPETKNIEVLYQASFMEWDGLVTDGLNGAYVKLRDDLIHIDENGNLTTYSSYAMKPTALSSDGKVYGISENSKEVVFIESAWQAPQIVAGDFSCIFDVAINKSGEIYVSDWDTGKITRINATGDKYTYSHNFNQKDPIDLGLSPNGTLYVQATGIFYRFNPKTENFDIIEWVAGSENMAIKDFVFVNDTIIYFVDPTNNNLVKVNLRTKEINFIIKGVGNSRALDVDSNDFIYLGDNSGFPEDRAQILKIHQNKSIDIYASNLDTITDLSFTLDNYLYVTTWYFNKTLSRLFSSVLLIDPLGNLQVLAKWNDSQPDYRRLTSISADPLTGEAIAYDKENSELIRVNKSGEIKVLPYVFHFETVNVWLDHMFNGTLYAIEINKTYYETGPWVERYIIRFSETSSPIIVANFSHIGSQTTENIAVSNSSQIYILGYKLIGNDMCLWNITTNGNKTIISDKLPIDPLAVAVDSEENLYVTCSAGLIKIYKSVEDSDDDGDSDIISGFDLSIIILAFIAISTIILLKKKMKTYKEYL